MAVDPSDTPPDASSPAAAQAAQADPGLTGVIPPVAGQPVPAEAAPAPAPTEQPPTASDTPPVTGQSDFGAVPDEGPTNEFGAIPDEVHPADVAQPDMSALHEHFATNVPGWHPPMAGSGLNISGSAQNLPPVKNPDGTPAPIWTKKSWEDFTKNAAFGFGHSLPMMWINGKMPESVTAESAPMAAQIAASMGTAAGDVPGMLAFGAIGGGVGATVGTLTGPLAPLAVPAFATAGEFVGTWAITPVLRSLLIDHYQKGDIQDFDDFYARASAAFIAGAKGLGTGVASLMGAGIGGAVAGKALGTAGATVIGAGVKTASQVSGEVIAMANAGAAMEGRFANKQDYVSNAALILGMKALPHAAGSAKAGFNELGARINSIGEGLEGIGSQTPTGTELASGDVTGDHAPETEAPSSSILRTPAPPIQNVQSPNNFNQAGQAVSSDEQLRVAGKLMEIFRYTGIHPQQVAEHASQDPVVAQEVTSMNSDIPSMYRQHMDVQNPNEFTMVDGKMVPTKDAPMQGQFDFTPTGALKEIGFENGRSTEEQRLAAARQLDPEAYKALDQMDADVKSHRDTITKNRKELETLEASEEQYGRLQELHAKNNPENEGPHAKYQPERSLMGGEDERARDIEEEKELAKREPQLRADAERAQSLRNENDVLQKRLARIKGNDSIPKRVAEAYRQGVKTLHQAARTRLSSMRIVLPDMAEGQKPLMADMGLEDSNPDPVSLSEGGAHNLLLHDYSDDQGDLFNQDKKPVDQSPGMIEMPSEEGEKAPETPEAPKNFHEDVDHAAQGNDPYQASLMTGLPIDHFYPGAEEDNADSASMGDHPSAQELHGKSKAKEPLAEKTPLKAAMDEAIGKIHKDKENDLVSRLARSPKALLDIFTGGKTYQQLMDRLGPIKGVAPKAYELMRLASDYMGTLKRFTTYNTTDLATGKVNGEGLQTILKPFAAAGEDRMNELRAYMFAKRDQENVEQGFGSRIGNTSRAEIIRYGDADPELKGAVERMVDWNNRVLKYYADSGGLSKEDYDGIVAKNKYYFKIREVQDEGDGPGTSRYSKVKNALKSRTGAGDGDINDPMTAMADNAAYLIKLAHENMATGKLLEEVGASGVFEKVATPLDEIMARAGKDASELRMDPATLEKLRGMRSFLKPGEFSYRRDGKVEVYKADPEIADAVNNMIQTGAPPGLIGKMLSAYATWKRGVLALSPGFMARHIYKNAFISSINSGDMSAPFALAKEGLAHFAQDSKEWQEFLSSGATNENFQDLNKNYIEKNIWGLSKETNMMGKVWNVIKHPVDAMHTATTFADTMTRAGSFIRNLPEGGNYSKDQVTSAAYKAREVIPDPTRMGLAMKDANRIIPFLNLHLQGLDKFGRMSVESPGATLAAGLTYLTAPALAGYVWNHYIMKDDQIDQLSRTDRDLYMPISLGPNMEPAKIPVAFAPGMLFQTLPVRILDRFRTENPDAFHGVLASIAQSLVPSVMSGAGADLIYENMSGKSAYSGQDLTPKNLQAGKASVSMRSTQYTSELAKLISHTIGKLPGLSDNAEINQLSPIMIDNDMKNLLGVPGEVMNHALDKALRAGSVVVPPSTSWSDLPVIREFFARNPNMNAEPLVIFRENQERANELFGDVKKSLKAGDSETAQSILANPQNRSLMLKMGQVQKTIEFLQTEAHKVAAAPGLSADEKTQTIIQMHKKAVDTAVLGNTVYNQLKAQRESNQ